MDLSNKELLSAAVSRLRSTLGVTVDSKLEAAYLRGEQPTLLSYEKIEKSEVQVPVIWKYLLGVSSQLAQPSLSYYDIHRVGRIVPLLATLDRAVSTLIERQVEGHQERFSRLIKATGFDEFESILFEVAVAAKYAALPNSAHTRFIATESTKRPDIETTIDGNNYYVECKKPDRRNSASIEMRNTIASKCQRTIQMFAKSGISANIEVTFLTDPALAEETELKDMAFASLQSGSLILSRNATIHTKPISLKPLKDYALFPSPGYFHDHFDYDIDGEWHGIIPCLAARWKTPSWLDDVSWQCAVKWKVVNEDQIRKVKQFGYNLIFKGIEQLNNAGENSILHFWIERDRALGHRQKQLMHFLETLKDRNRDKFAWIIFNELSPNLSRFGRFDCEEHAHPISGIYRATADAPVRTVFVMDENLAEGLGEFGIGHTLPNIDSGDESWRSKRPK